MASLLEAADVQVTLRLVDVRQVYGEACRPLLGLIPAADDPARARGEERVRSMASEIVARAEATEMLHPEAQHRALPDAERLWRTWRAIGAEVRRPLAEEGRRRGAGTREVHG